MKKHYLTVNNMVKAQSALEFVIVGAVIAAVLLVMSGYFKRGLAGKYKNTADSQLEGQFDPDKGNAFYATKDSGTSESVEKSDTVLSKNIDGTPVETDFSMSYQVAGPSTKPIVDKDGNTVISADNSRQPLKSTTVSHFDADWDNLKMNQ
jgi:hypothetical protein